MTVMMELMALMALMVMMGVDVNVLFREERESRYRYPRCDLVSSVGIGISSLLFPASSGKRAETPGDSANVSDGSGSSFSCCVYTSDG